MPIIDAHHHLWDLSAVDYPWLHDGKPRFFGDPAPIATLHDLPRFRQSHSAADVVASVHVQVGAADPLAETRWLAGQAGQAHWPLAIIAAADLTAPDLAATLDRLTDAAGGRLAGIRQIIARHPGEDGPTPGRLLDRPDLARGLGVLAAHGLGFDLQLTAPLLPRAAKLFATFPDLRIALCHCGSPWDPTDAGMARWADDLALFADAVPQAMVKLSGLGMLRPGGSGVPAIVAGTLKAFGAARTMWGSNWPVDALHRDGWTAILDEASALLAPHDQAAILAGNAARFYRLSL